MKYISNSIAVVFLVLMAGMLGGCNDGKTYAELLNEENLYVNNFLADNKVILDIPADTIFEVGPDAPYYRIDEDGNLYMQVLDAGTKDNKVQDDEQIYFRYTRYALAGYSDGKLPEGEGNNLSLATAWFRYNNYQIQSSYQWGSGIQTPLSLLPVDCRINLIIKSPVGVTDEISNVQPYLWSITYRRRQ